MGPFNWFSATAYVINNLIDFVYSVVAAILLV